MKKTLTFVPLGIGISAAIIYLFNVFRFRIINNSATLLQILNNLRIYLYISIGGFLFYFLIKILSLVSSRKNIKTEKQEEKTSPQVKYKPFYVGQNKTIGEDKYPGQDSYVPNYGYVPMYGQNKYDKKNDVKDEILKNNEAKPRNILEDSEDVNIKTTYCMNCGQLISNDDLYCKRCGSIQNKSIKTNSLFKKIINVLEIVILILVLYFLINMLFDYKEKSDPNFKSPLKINVTK